MYCIITVNYASGIYVCSFPFQLKGEVDDCSCKVESVDSFNNLKIYPRLNSLLEKDYFKYWKVSFVNILLTHVHVKMAGWGVFPHTIHCLQIYFRSVSLRLKIQKKSNSFTANSRIVLVQMLLLVWTLVH